MSKLGVASHPFISILSLRYVEQTPDLFNILTIDQNVSNADCQSKRFIVLFYLHYKKAVVLLESSSLKAGSPVLYTMPAEKILANSYHSTVIITYTLYRIPYTVKIDGNVKNSRVLSRG